MCCLAELPFMCGSTEENNRPMQDSHSSIDINDIPNCNINEDVAPDYTVSTRPSEADDKMFEPFKNKGLHIIHINSRSVIHKIEEIKILSYKVKAAVICVTETWLDESVTNSEIEIKGYQVIRKDRNRSGGGVCMYINTNLAFNQRNDLETDELEALWCEILLPKTKPIVVGCCYRPPKQNKFLERMEENISKLCYDSETIILGDMNICFHSKTGHMYNKYINILRMYGMEQVISETTRETSKSATILDHIICNKKEKISQYGVMPIGISDHYITYCTRKIVRECINSHNSIKIRSMKTYNVQMFNEKLSNENWRCVYEAKTVDEAWSTFRDILIKIIDKVAPLKEIRIKQRTEPWMTSDILDKIKERDRILAEYKRNKNNEEKYNQFCKIRNKIQQDIKRVKSDYISNKIQENNNDSKKLWQQLKNLGYSGKSKENSKTVLRIEDELCFDEKKVVSYFNNFFTTVASTLVSKLPYVDKIFSTDSYNFKNYYRSKGLTDNNFKLVEVTEEYVYRVIMKLGVNKGTGLDCLPARFIVDGARILKGPITYIINMSISTSEVPKGLKEARVKPLYKKNNRQEVGNYRPVSILNVISKVLERAVYDQLSNYLRSNNVIYDFQSGFRNDHSTDTCLIHLFDLLKTNSSKGNYTGLVFLDLQKAFDTVDHYILCNKLRAMGVKSVEWFYSYLCGRSQIVKIDEHCSEACNISCGVPQGSILGPLLFLCYVNDMKISVSCQLLLYADDSVLIVSHKDPEVVANRLGKELETCNTWMINNKLSLHLGKTETMLVGSKKKLEKVHNFKITCLGQTIEGVKSVKYLGVFLDRCASGELNCQLVIKRINARLKFMYRQAKDLNQKVKKTLCSALIQPHFDYACSSWYSGVGSKSKKQLQICQNKIIRFIMGVGPRTHIGQTEREKVNMLSVNNRVRELKLNHAHNIFNNRGPAYLAEHFQRRADNQQVRTRNSQFNFNVKSVHGSAAHTFYNTAIKEWNSLPSNLQSLVSKDQFKTSLRNHLFEQERLNELNDYVYY